MTGPPFASKTPFPTPTRLKPPPDPWESLAEKVAEAVVRRLKLEEAPRLLTPEEAAAYLNRSKSWLRRAVLRGELPCVRQGKSRPRFDRAALDRWLDERPRN